MPATAMQNAAIVARAYAAFNDADMATLTETFDERASWHTPGRSPIAGDREGREATFAQFGHYASETGDTFRASLERVLESEDGRVVGIHRNTAERDGKALDVMCAIAFELEDGRITSGREHFEDLYSWDEFWS